MLHSTSPDPTQALRTRRIVHWLLSVSLLLCGVQQGVHAAIYSCSAADGTTLFQDRPCPENTPDRKRTTSPVTIRTPPLGIHASWFDRPTDAMEHAECDEQRCICGTRQQVHGESLDLAVADALYLDGAWHRYQTRQAEWQRQPAASELRERLHADMQNAACTVLMSQQLLRNFASDLASRLRRESSIAEGRGFDQPGPCDAGVVSACRYLALTQLYRRLLDDAQALQMPRDIIFSDNKLPIDQ